MSAALTLADSAQPIVQTLYTVCMGTLVSSVACTRANGMLLLLLLLQVKADRGRLSSCRLESRSAVTLRVAPEAWQAATASMV